MRLRTILLPSLICAISLISACTTTPAAITGPTPPGATTCDHTLAQWTIGERASDTLLERARVAARARSARFLRPNQVITLEFLGSRLNLNLDGQDIVRSVSCG